VYIAVMVAAGASHNAAMAGDLVFRTLTYLLPIPVGGLTYVIWRRKKIWRKPASIEPPSSV
jgi:putative heme transporter